MLSGLWVRVSFSLHSALLSLLRSSQNLARTLV
jgi:hypothetical protein